MIVEKLLGCSGDVRRILGIAQSGPLDLSDAKDWTRPEVLRDLRFDEIFISEAEIRLNFVECRFTGCVFRRVRSDAHFWGADDIWTRCVFEDSNLARMISPMNSFRDCRFQNSTITNFRPYQTLFENCSFTGFAFQGIKAELIQNAQMRNAALDSISGSVLFRKCRFLRSSFRECYFDGIVFEACEFADVSIEACDFSGIVSDFRWWGDRNDDPFAAFLSKALDLIDKQCGKSSQAYQVFHKYVTDYCTGNTQDKDFSACLYSGNVSRDEVQRVSKELKRLVNQFRF